MTKACTNCIHYLVCNGVNLIDDFSRNNLILFLIGRGTSIRELIYNLMGKNCNEYGESE